MRGCRALGPFTRCCMENGYAKAVDCPDRAELAGFVTGNLSGKAFERIAQHVEKCSACEIALGAFDSVADPFLVQLRGAAVNDTRSEAPVPRELLAAARSMHG